MNRYFAYPRINGLRRDAERLGVELALVEDREEIRLVLARAAVIHARSRRFLMVKFVSLFRGSSRFASGG